MNFSHSNRGAGLVFLLALLASSIATSGCAGVASSLASNAGPLPDPSSAAQLTVTPSSISVTAVVGTAGSQVVTATNAGKYSISINQAAVTGVGFTTAGLTLPVTVAAGSSRAFTVDFAATTPGTVTGSLSITTSSSSNPVVVQLSATAAAAPSTRTPAPTPPPPPATPGPVVSSVTVSPTTATLTVQGALAFAAAVQGTTSNFAVTWKSSTGSISSAGLYTAPTTPGTSTVTATSVADPTKSASATVTVKAAPATPGGTSITISPTVASATTGATIRFTAAVKGASNTSVTWKSSSGTITSAGLYTAPAAAGTSSVTATSVADSTKSASATITVSTPALPVVNSIAISPSSTSVTTGGALQFADTVSGTVTDKSVTWKAALGTITSAGLYSAPAQPGTDTVTVTSHADASKSATATVLVDSPAPPPSGDLPAFPGAQGGGAPAVGGRAGQVIEVTNLNDSGTGSLRQCASGSGTRTCVFRVAGIIHPASSIDIRHSDLTIAGQTAPGGGIALQGDRMPNGPMFFITANDVIIRYLTCSIGNGSGHAPGPSAGASCFQLASGNDQQHVIFDHLTMRWWDDKPYLLLSNSGFSPITNTVMQWSLFYEPNFGHQVGPMTDDTGGFANQDTGDDFHHNLFANIGHRLPLYNTKSGRWVNNIVFNWDFYALLAQGGVKIDIINNKYVAGNLNRTNDNHEFDFNHSQSDDDPASSMPGPPSAYLSGNVGPHQSNPSGNQMLMTSKGSEAGDTGGAVPASWFRSSPMSAQAIPIVADFESNLDAVLLPTVGNSRGIDCNGNWVNHRDSVDTRIVTQYQNKSPGGYFTTADSTHSQPSIPAGTSCAESLHDGIPDQWKSTHGLSITDPNLHNEKAPDGYTYLEDYMNGPQ